MATGATNVQGDTKPVEEDNLKVEYDNIDFSLFEFESGYDKNVNIKGRLREHTNYWENTLKANDEIMKILREGYRLPFIYTPTKKEFSNYKSVLRHKSFVDETLQALLDQGLVRESNIIPEVVSPLLVSGKNDKRRLIIDLRYVNSHLLKQKIKFDDWKCFENFLTPQSKWLYKFDLKSGYHHIEIFEGHQTYLGFSWKVKGVQKYFVFCVLPFGLSPAPYIFTKIMRVQVKFWRSKGICIAVFIDDGFGVDVNDGDAYKNSLIVLEVLRKSGFLINLTKSVMKPCNVLTWLGISLDLVQQCMFISEDRIASLKFVLAQILSSPYTTARKLSTVAGKINSMYYVLGSIVRLMTRGLYRTIADRSAWDSTFNYLYYHKAVDELMFWKHNCDRLNKKPIFEYKVPRLLIFSDASGTGCGSIIHSNDDQFICYKNFDSTEISYSSTWRELESIKYALLALKPKTSGNALMVHTDNWAASEIVNVGSNKDHLQKLALEIYYICKEQSINLKVRWIPREVNVVADKISKDIDYDDWEISGETFQTLNHRWGPITIDRFANHKNRKVLRYNSKYFCPDSEAVDCFSVNWSQETNLLVPPVYLLPKTVKHLLRSSSGTTGIIVAPLWTSASFWPLIIQGDGNMKNFIKDWIVLESNALQQGSYKGIIGSERFKNSVIALQIIV